MELAEAYDPHDEYEEEEEKELSPLEREWEYLRTRARDLEVDLTAVKSEYDAREFNMESYNRLVKVLANANDLLKPPPVERLATAVGRELDYLRAGLDKHRERMSRELDYHSRRSERDARDRERDAETLRYRNFMADSTKPKRRFPGA